MEIYKLIEQYKGERNKEIRGIFSSIFIFQNRLQTIFDKADPYITVKQFMLLAMVKHSTEKQTYTHLGKLLGCSRQNIKKLVISLEKKGYLINQKSNEDKRTSYIIMTEKANEYFDEISNIHQIHLAELFSEYSDEEISFLYKTLMKLHSSIDKFEREY
ncbi:MarR family winged helix-turn-helix transcriptional regulator [Enterococcus ureasiticus]|uniref:HTH-type transcriptional regulator MgrA n=1 Tax=Enterococcus ureasiticus TaxID=903984 RepID=A0A1E5GFC8_9ENTE|nr:winged helix DNA-binding protein [Enterococcus ureasiticus]OEG11426.1 MarR family transcriptional regulator [Enterococcus ureasiticus]